MLCLLNIDVKAVKQYVDYEQRLTLSFYKNVNCFIYLALTYYVTM